MTSYTAQDICERVQGRLSGDGGVSISGIAVLSEATPQQISFLRDSRFGSQLAESQAGVVLVADDAEIPEGQTRTLIRVKNADLALVKVLELFVPPRPKPQAGVHPTAVVDPTAKVGADVAIGPFCMIGARTTIGDGCALHANTCLMDDAHIGSNCEVFPNVVIREYCEVGTHCILHSNVVIGTDGFGYEPAEDGSGLVKVPHIGNVKIGNFVEIGAGTCIDRAKLSSTVIGDGTKIDNQCQIAHNVTIGRMSVICGQTALAGSVTIGDGVMIGGRVAMRDQVTVGDFAKLAGGSVVASDVPQGETWGGYPAQEANSAMREVMALKSLPRLVRIHKQELRKMREADSGGN